LYYTASGIFTTIGGRPVKETGLTCIIQFALLTMSTCARNM